MGDASGDAGGAGEVDGLAAPSAAGGAIRASRRFPSSDQVMTRNIPFAGKGRRSYLVTLPLHDLNGDVIGAVRVEMDTFPGQTDDNAVARALPVVRRMERRVTTVKELTE